MMSEEQEYGGGGEHRREMVAVDCTTPFRVYRAVTAWLVLVVGLLHVALGGWYTSQGWSVLDMRANQVVDFTTRGEIVVVGTGVGLVLCSVALLCGAWYREGKVSFGLRLCGCSVALTLLAFEIVVAWVILVNRDKTFETQAYQQGWNLTLSNHSELICALEHRFSCRGFLDASCKAEACAKCSTTSPLVEACFAVMKRHLATSYWPVSITSTLLGVLVLGDLILACLLR